MEMQMMIDAGLAGGMALFGWFAREMWAAVKELKGDIATLREHIPHEYVRQDHYRADVRELKEMVGKIFDKLDAKQDKSGNHIHRRECDK
jgi:hypothetical protein